MLTQRTLIPIGAGLISAVTFVSVAIGHPGLGVLLFLIIPLPLMLVGLSHGWPAASLAGVSACIAILIIAGPLSAAAFAAGFAAPPIVLSYLALLNRPGESAENREWYPVGRLVLACALIGGLLSSLFALVLGGTHDALKAAVGPAAEATLKAQLKDAPTPTSITEADIASLVDAAVTLMPAMMALTAMGVLLLNLWIAGRVTRSSGSLSRPWPDLGQLEYPRGTPLVLAATTGAGFLESFPGMVGSAFSGALFLAYVLVGLAIAHYNTQGASWRTFALWALYMALLFINPTILLVALAGLADAIWPLRGRRDEG